MLTRVTNELKNALQKKKLDLSAAVAVALSQARVLESRRCLGSAMAAARHSRQHRYSQVGIQRQRRISCMPSEVDVEGDSKGARRGLPLSVPQTTLLGSTLVIDRVVEVFSPRLNTPEVVE